MTKSVERPRFVEAKTARCARCGVYFPSVEAIKRDDGAVAAVLEKLAGASCSQDEASLLIGALGAAGTAAAQDGLEEIITAEDSPVERKEVALFAFAEVESPRMATVSRPCPPTPTQNAVGAAKGL